MEIKSDEVTESRRAETYVKGSVTYMLPTDLEIVHGRLLLVSPRAKAPRHHFDCLLV